MSRPFLIERGPAPMRDFDADYATMRAEAFRQLRAGELLAVLEKWSPERGRTIEVMSDQGWNPDPFYAEFPTPRVEAEP